MRSALIVISGDYADPALKRLRAPVGDAQALAAVLRDPFIGGFEVRTLLNEQAHVVNLAVEEFFADRRPDDLLLTYFFCLGIKDVGDELYFAASNTVLDRPGATAVAAEFVSRCISRSRSRQVVLLLDCPYVGLFERGTTARPTKGMASEARYGGEGQAVIASSSTVEYRFEGDQLVSTRAVVPSVFTNALVEGLQTGDADRDRDGVVTLDELYDYIYANVGAATPNQTPTKWISGLQSGVIIARRAEPVITPAPLPSELKQTQGMASREMSKSGETPIITPSTPAVSRRKFDGRKAKLFISYSHRDDRYREQLVTHLAGLRRQGVIADWHDRKIVPGKEWREAIDQNLNTADCVLLLVSPDFLASDYCYSIEMQRTLEKHWEGDVLVIPVIVRPSDWQNTPLGDLEALPKDAKPVVEWGPQRSGMAQCYRRNTTCSSSI